jgi:hypothetical protein
MSSCLLLIGVAAISLAVLPASARLGETKQEVDTRYGDGKDVTGTDPNAKLIKGAQQFFYHPPSGEVNVIFYEGKSVSERILLKNVATRKADAQAILDANAQGSHWTFREKENRWRRTDQKAVAWFFGPEWLFLSDAAYLKACEKDKGSGPSVSGF